LGASRGHLSDSVIYLFELLHTFSRTLMLQRSNVEMLLLLILSGKLLAERCRTDDLMPSIPFFCLPPSRVDPKVLGLNVLIYHFQPGGSWTTRGLRQSGGGRIAAAMTRWWSSSGADRARCPRNVNRNDLTFSETGKQPVMLLAVSFVVCLVYGIRKIFPIHQVSKADVEMRRTENEDKS